MEKEKTLFKNGKEALLIAFITGAFGALTVLLKDQQPYIAISAFIVTVVAVYIIIWRSMGRIKAAIGKPDAHPVFYTIDTSLKIAFDYLPIEHVKKKRLVILYIKTKFRLIKEAMNATIDDGQITALPARIIEAISHTREELRGKAPEEFLDKMGAWDNKYTAWTMETMRSIVDSNYYQDQDMKYSACFDCVQVMVRSTLVAAENAIDELNGELEIYLDGRNDV